MDLNIVKKLVKIVDESNVTDLEIEENGFKIKVAKKLRTAGVQVPGSISYVQPSAVTVEAVPQQISTVPAKVEDSAVAANMHEVRSPIVGTFYSSPSPDAPSYVKVGDAVTQGKVLCIVEAMKLMNEIESDCSGTIVKVLVEDGRPVEYNQPLFLIQTS